MSQDQSLLVGCGEWGFRELPVPEHFTIARRLGFRYLEIGIGGNFPGRLPSGMSPADVRDLRALARAHEIQTPHCCLENDFTLPQLEKHKLMLSDTLRDMELAAQLDAKQIRLFAGFTPADVMTDPLWRQMIDAFAACQKRASQLGISIAIETHGAITWRDGAAIHQHTVTTEARSLKRLLKELPPEIGINYDPGNLKPLTTPQEQCHLSLLNDRISYCHLKDWRRHADGWQAVAIGDDDLDYAALLARMQYRGVYLIEYEPVQDVVDGIERSLNYLKRIGISYRFA